MRAAGAVSVVIAAVALCLGCGELLAKTQAPAVVPSMLAQHEVAQLRNAAWDWWRATATSTPFLVGTAFGIVVAEAGHFVLRWLGRTVGLVSYGVNFFVRHRLISAGLAGLVYYVTVFHIIA